MLSNQSMPTRLSCCRAKARVMLPGRAVNAIPARAVLYTWQHKIFTKLTVRRLLPRHEQAAKMSRYDGLGYYGLSVRE